MAFYVVPRRRSVLAGVTAAIALLLGGTAFVQFQAASSWSAMQRKVGELRTKWESRERRREPLWGDATTERAYEHYRRASDAAMALCSAHNDALMALLPLRGDGLPTAELRNAWQAMLEDLHRGAHATDLRPTADPYGGVDTTTLSLLPLRWVANCALFEARVLLHEERAIDAARVSLDAASLGADLLRDDVLINRMIGSAVLAIAMDTWSGDRMLARLDGDSLALLADGLERLDRSLPSAPDLTGELLLSAYALQHLPDGIEAMSAWRHGFSTRWMIADEWLRYAKGADEVSRDALPWPQQEVRLQAAAETAGAGGLLLPVPHVLLGVESNVRCALLRVRMLRVAVDVHRGRDVPVLADPFGDGPLCVAHESGGVRITSAGSTERRKLERFVAR